MSAWDNVGVARPLTRELIISAHVRAEQAIITPTQIICHPRQYVPLLLVSYGITYRRQDDDVFSTPRLPWWRRWHR